VVKSADNLNVKQTRFKTEDQLTWQEIELGGMSIDPGSAAQLETGGWRSRRPTYDFTKCIKCGLCQTYCPEGCIHPREDGTYEADLYYCKGCGICARECPKKVITMVEEKE
jgi:pyruvate ferredoxin oxidoreductase delta subunit